MISDLIRRARRFGHGFGWGDVLVVTATAIWGVNVVVVKLALTDSGPFTYSAARYVIGGLALCGLARWLEGPLVRPRGSDAWLILVAAATDGEWRRNNSANESSSTLVTTTPRLSARP